MTEQINEIEFLKTQLEQEELKKKLIEIKLQNARMQNELEPISKKAYKAYCELQTKIIQVEKSHTVKITSQKSSSITTYKHATLAEILDNISDVLKEHNLFIKETQEPIIVDNTPLFLKYKVELYCEDYKVNQCEDVINYVTSVDQYGKINSLAGAKDLAAVITYKRRYLIKSLLNIAEKDDDNEAKKSGSKIEVNKMTYDEVIDKINNAKSRDDLLIACDHLTKEQQTEILKQKELKASELFTIKVKKMTKEELADSLLKTKEPYQINIIKNRLTELENQ